MLTSCDYSLKVTLVHNFMKIVEITHFLHNSVHHVTQISKFFQIWNLEAKSLKMSYYTTMFNKLENCQKWCIIAQYLALRYSDQKNSFRFVI